MITNSQSKHQQDQQINIYKTINNCMVAVQYGAADVELSHKHTLKTHSITGSFSIHSGCYPSNQ